jgi:hypothetical protein
MAHGGHHGYPVTQQMRLERRQRAETVAQESGYALLTTKEKLERVLNHVLNGAGEAKKQRARLEAQLIKEQDQDPKKTVKSK